MVDRRGALASCIVELFPNGKERYSVLRDRYAPFLHKTPFEAVSEQQLLDALAEIERDRNRALERLRAFERQRIRAKLRGRRSPSKSEWRLLEDHEE
jgi:CDP-glycerol glycerophosphotransferase (TagB/SpsB family)